MEKISYISIPNGNKVIYLDTIESTNLYASELASKENTEEGTVIWTHTQSLGRGQKGTVWQSEPGKNLTVSVLLFPEFLLASDQFILSKMVALSVVKTIQKWIPSGHVIKIKWPNDIYVDSVKIAGILIENSIQNSKIRQSILGIGINVNQTNFPSEINATSLFNLLKKEIDLIEILNDLCESLSLYYTQIKSGQFKTVNDHYLNLLYLLNEWALFDWENERIRAKITGINHQGKLQLLKENNEIGTADLKEIIFVREL